MRLSSPEDKIIKRAEVSEIADIDGKKLDGEEEWERHRVWVREKERESDGAKQLRWKQVLTSDTLTASGPSFKTVHIICVCQRSGNNNNKGDNGNVSSTEQACSRVTCHVLSPDGFLLKWKLSFYWKKLECIWRSVMAAKASASSLCLSLRLWHTHKHTSLKRAAAEYFPWGWNMC